MDRRSQVLKPLLPARARPIAKRLYHRALPGGRQRELMAERLRAKPDYLGGSSKLYEDLRRRAAVDVRDGGPCWEVLRAQQAPPVGIGDAVAHRFMTAVHRLVLEGRAPRLAEAFEAFAADGSEGGDRAWRAFLETVADHRESLLALMERPVQTNEVGRSAALLGGFLSVARDTGFPLRVLEVGASAGLNLLWDRYRYETPDAAWGDPGSPVRFADAFVGGCPPLDVPAGVAERRGCDLAPLDPRSLDDRLTLISHVAPDETLRITRIRNALEMARRDPAPVDRADAVEWVAAQLDRPVPGVATVVFHSVVMQYLDERSRHRFARIVEEAGRAANDTAPLAWLRMEPSNGPQRVELTTWPPGSERLLATTDQRARAIRWLAG